MAGGHTTTWEEWSGLVQYLLGAFFTILGLHFLLYNRAKSHQLWKDYFASDANVVSGTVLSCEAASRGSNTSIDKHEVAILYEAAGHKYWDNPRLRFRYPNAIETKRYLRRFMMDTPMVRGASVDVLLLSGMPRSGCIREVVERNVANYSHVRVRTLLIGVPGLLLLSIFIGLCIRELMNMGEISRSGWAVLALAVVGVFFSVKIVCHFRFKRERDRRFNCAVPMKTATNSLSRGDAALANEKAEPLLACGSRNERQREQKNY